MKNNKIEKLSPLEELRQRKLVLVEECQQDEERFFKAVDGFKNSWKGLLLNSILSSSKSATRSFFSSSKGTKNSNTVAEGGGIVQKLVPLVWTILQPILMKVVMNKIKGLFVKTKK